MTPHQIKLIATSPYKWVNGEWYKGTTPINEGTVRVALCTLIGNTVPQEELELAALNSEASLQQGDVSKSLTLGAYLKHFYWRSTNGNLVVYYSPTENNELVSLQLSQEESYRPFLNALREVPGWLQQFVDDYSSQANKKLTLEAFASQVFKALTLMPEQQLQEEPSSISWNTQDKTFKRFDPDTVDRGSTNAWDQFLDRLSNKEIFLAFVWSIFDPRNQGRQVLWLRGPGNDGKSRVISALSRYLGSRAVAALSQGTVSSQFFSSFVYGKRLVVFGDCMHTRLISTSAIHTLVGGDYASIEAKGKQAFAGRLYSKVIIGSNYAPEVDNTANQVSRLLYLTVSPLAVGNSNLPAGDDTDFEEQLVREMPQLLYLAKEAYEKRCPNHGRINISDTELEHMLTQTKSDIQEYVERFCEEHLIFTPDEYVKVQDLNTYFTYSSKYAGIVTNSSLDINLLNRYIEEKLKLSKERRDGRRVWVGARMSTQFEQHINNKVMA